VVSDILCDWTFSLFFFFIMYYSAFWILGKFTIFNFSDVFSFNTC